MKNKKRGVWCGAAVILVAALVRGQRLEWLLDLGPGV